MSDTIPLRELVSISKGKKPDQVIDEQRVGFSPYLTAAQLLHGDVKKWAKGGVATNPSDVLISWDGTVGNVGWGITGIVGSTIGIIRPDLEQVDVAFLGRFLSSKKQLLNDKATGATIKHIRRSVLENLDFPAISLSEQRRIATILGKADEINEATEHISSYRKVLIHSIFLNIFGDPVLNPSNWDVVLLGTVSKIRSGATKGRKFNGKETVFSPYLRVANVQDGHFELSEIKQIEVLPSDIDKFLLKRGDVLMTEGGDFDKLGRGAVWNEEVPDCIHQNHIFRVRPDTTVILPEFLNAVTGSMRGKRYFLSSSKQTTGIASINKRQLSNFPMLLPPLSLQQEFVERVRSISALYGLMGNRVDLKFDMLGSVNQVLLSSW